MIGGEEVEEEPARRLQLSCRLARARKAGKYQPRHPCDLPELPPRHLRRVERCVDVVAQVVGETRTGYEWLVDGIAAGIGALFASEFIMAWRTFDPVVDGLAIVPALLGGLAVGLVVEIATRYLTGGTYTRHSMA